MHWPTQHHLTGTLPQQWRLSALEMPTRVRAPHIQNKPCHTLVTHRRQKQPLKVNPNHQADRAKSGTIAHASTQAHLKQLAPTSNNLQCLDPPGVPAAPSLHNTRTGAAARHTGFRSHQLLLHCKHLLTDCCRTGQTHKEAPNTHTMGGVLLPRTPARYVAAAPPTTQGNASGLNTGDPHTHATRHTQLRTALGLQH